MTIFFWVSLTLFSFLFWPNPTVLQASSQAVTYMGFSFLMAPHQRLTVDKFFLCSRRQEGEEKEEEGQE